MRLTIPVLAAAALLSFPAVAQTPPAPMSGHMSMNAGNAASGDMMESMNKMNQAMSSAPMTGNPDHDFTAMMIPHHQGAIDMANYELQHGRDPALRKLARDIVAAQDKEIAFMKRWLAAHPAK